MTSEVAEGRRTGGAGGSQGGGSRRRWRARKTAQGNGQGPSTSGVDQEVRTAFYIKTNSLPVRDLPRDVEGASYLSGFRRREFTNECSGSKLNNEQVNTTIKHCQYLIAMAPWHVTDSVVLDRDVCWCARKTCGRQIRTDKR